MRQTLRFIFATTFATFLFLTSRAQNQISSPSVNQDSLTKERLSKKIDSLKKILEESSATQTALLRKIYAEIDKDDIAEFYVGEQEYICIRLRPGIWSTPLYISGSFKSTIEKQNLKILVQYQNDEMQAPETNPTSNENPYKINLSGQLRIQWKSEVLTHILIRKN